MYWLGDSQMWNEKSLTGDCTSSYGFSFDAKGLTQPNAGAWYLREEFLDHPPGERCACPAV